jgi:hypothetical protein
MRPARHRVAYFPLLCWKISLLAHWHATCSSRGTVNEKPTAMLATHADTEPALEFVHRMQGAGEGPAWRAAYRDAFAQLRSRVAVYPDKGQRPSAVFESAARTVRPLAADCLPLGIAVVMHLYPLCALQCIPIPWMSFARFQRSVLLQAIRKRSLIVANAGSERVRQPGHSILATQVDAGIRIDGSFEYMSLASVADIAFFKAPLADSRCSVLCAADLHADTVRIGGGKFVGSMRLSDTSSVEFAGHHIPTGRYAILGDEGALRCTQDYQRCWFHLFLCEIHLARLARLHRTWELPHAPERAMSLNELSGLREYALRLLDDSASTRLAPLTKTTSAMKLRVSTMAQATMALLRERERAAPAFVSQLRADASELYCIRSQPTSDDRILRSIGIFDT